MKQQLTKLRVKLIKIISLQHIDQHQSFQFIKRKYDIYPSEIITVAFLIVSLLFIILDGFGLISSLFNFAFPIYSLYQEIAINRQNKTSIKLKSQSQNSHLTDQEFSQVISNKFFSRSQILEVYIVFFMFYITTQIISPIMEFIIGAVAWLILRCILTIVMTKTRQRLIVVSKIIQYTQNYVRKQEFIGRRRMEEL